jgi:uncharacterized protein
MKPSPKKAEDKPIFLSSGYSTCHWCHVMERESFENEEIAALVPSTSTFIPVKVDREERPDVDLTYMTYVQAATGGGGWPMTVFPHAGFEALLRRHLLPSRRTKAGASVSKTCSRNCTKPGPRTARRCWKAPIALDKLQEHLDGENEGAEVKTEAVMQKAYDDLASSYDYHEGGFSGAPKFPRSTSINLLFRIHARLDGQRRDARARPTGR